MVCVEALRKVDWLCPFVVIPNQSIIPLGSKTAGRLPDAELGVPSTTVAKISLTREKKYIFKSDRQQSPRSEACAQVVQQQPWALPRLTYHTREKKMVIENNTVVSGCAT